MSAQRFTKKRHVVQAMQWAGTPETATPIIDWVLAEGGTARYHPDEPERIVIDRLGGHDQALAGDWVVQTMDSFAGIEAGIFVEFYVAVGE